MKIGIITYDLQHKKTYDILTNFVNQRHDVTLLINKFKTYKTKRENPFFSHRPYQFNTPHPEEVAKNFNLPIKKFKNSKNLENLDYVVIGGSGVLDEEYIRAKPIINCHSGIIPYSRGLDAFKWAIRNKIQVGNTLHFIDKNIDYGRIIYVKKTHIFSNDSLNTFAERHYQEEISLLSNFVNYLNINFNYKKKKIISIPQKRMPAKIEKNISEDFKQYKKKFLTKKKFSFKNKINMPIISSHAIRNVKFGKNCQIVEPVNLYDCKLGNNVFIGPFVEITNGVEIGDNTRISSHSFVCTLVKIGKKCFIGHNVNFINDKFSKKKLGGLIKNWLPTYIGNNVLIGSNSTILPVKICNNVVIGAGSVVTKNISKPGIYAGNPAKFIR